MTFKFQVGQKNNSNVELCIDIVYKSGLALVVSIDEKVKYISVIHIAYQNEE